VRHVLQSRADIFIDSKCQVPLPITIPPGDITIHVIVVAHGATDACKAFSPDNISGSLAVAYRDNNVCPGQGRRLFFSLYGRSSSRRNRARL
jgi:hypothetical protein